MTTIKNFEINESRILCDLDLLLKIGHKKLLKSVVFSK